jgi:methanethiol S-methyltransferase
MKIWILALGWIFYFVIHSVLASVSVKDYFAKKLGNGFKYYRVTYSIISTVGLILLVTLNAIIPADYFFERTSVMRYISLMLATFGVMTIQLAFRQYPLKSFLGFREEKNELKIEGILKVIRHPIYSGIYLVTVGFFLFVPNLPTLISCLCIFIYLPIGIYLEERKLIKFYRAEYEKYKKEVPGLIPGMK